MNRRGFLIHGWEGYPEEGWRPWLKNELEKRGFTVSVPASPTLLIQQWTSGTVSYKDS